MASASRLKYIDIARGIAIICIILGHLGINEISRVVFTFHVPIFFFITGYFINDKLPIVDFIKKKFRTLIVPYICACIAIILLGTLISGIRYGGEAAIETALKWIYASFYGAGDSYTEPFYIKGIGAIWFLLASFWGSVFLRISLNMKKGARIIMVLALFVAGYWSFQKWFWFPLSIQAGCSATLFMYIGYLVKQSKEVYSKISTEVKLLSIIGASCIWLDFMINFKSFWLVRCDIGRGVIDIFGCICACYIVLHISRFIEKKTKTLANVLSFFGKYSLIVLCIHIIELNLFPWREMINYLAGFDIPYIICEIIACVLKLTFIVLMTILCSRSTRIKTLFGLVKKQ